MDFIFKNKCGFVCQDNYDELKSSLEKILKENEQNFI